MPAKTLSLPRRALVVVALAGVTLGGLLAPAAADPAFDGSSQARAAASCWEIKQDKPSASDGSYWLLTPELQAPTQFYCDMTTDGGGWVLVGRGRDGWNWDGDASGTPAQVAGTVTGTGAFAPRKLSNAVIDGLMGGRRIDSLSEGVRLRRAANTTGTSWQEARFTLRSRDRWSWGLGAGHPITSYSFDGATTNATTTTREFGSNTAQRRVWTFESANNNWVRGFNFGQGGTGSNAASSFVYSTASGGAYGTPFTQVFIRPRTTTSDLDYSAVSDAGTSAQTAPKLAKNGALTAPWGVTGTGAGGTGELATEAQAFAQVGNTMYVGGNFTTVRNSSGSESVAQPYLAAFNATTGEWIRSFRPQLNHQVKALTALPGGRLAVGGEFTTAQGAARRGLAVYDTATGALDPAWDTTLENRVQSTSKVSIRALDTDGTRLYVGGQFTHFVRGTSAVYARNAGRMVISTQRADTAWNPNFNGTVAALDVSDDASRVYFGGYFTTSGSATADRGAAVSTASGAALTPWTVRHSTSGSAKYQQAVKQAGDKVWLGGSQHNMFSYDTSTLALEDTGITRSGGDIQAMDANSDVVYAGCHCGDWNYSGTTNYDSLSIGQTNPAWNQADKVSLLGAWNASTGSFMPELAPQWKSRGGYGVWSLKVAQDGTLWTGGSMTSAVRENGSNQWVGGFVRFAQRPSTAPSAPRGLTVSLDGSTSTAHWTAGSTSGATYEVIRNNRVVATTTGTSVAVAGSAASDRWFVRASDGQGNRSASTSVARAAAAPAAPATVLESGSSWSYLSDNGTTVPAAWAQPTFDAGSWKSGTAALGWGTGPIATDIAPPAGTTRPLTSYFRRAFTVADPSAYATYTLTTRADDGVAVYVNGTEVTRKNLPAGTLTSTTYATAAPSTTAATSDALVVQIPASLLRAGANVIAAEVHSNYRSTPSVSFDAAVAARP